MEDLSEEINQMTTNFASTPIEEESSGRNFHSTISDTVETGSADDHQQQHHHHHHHNHQQESSSKVSNRSEGNLRKMIFEIQRNPDLSSIEKARKIQELMMGNYKLGSNLENAYSMLSAVSSHRGSPSALSSNVSSVPSSPRVMTTGAANVTMVNGENMDCCASPREMMITCKSLETGETLQLTQEEASKSYHNLESGILGCQHYMRGSKIQAECCGKWHACRLCHDETSSHQINRHATKNMFCMHCQSVQSTGQNCKNCGTQLAKYYCDICKLWDDNPEKSIYHCDKCGLCRVGKGLGIDYFHCDKCGVCLSMQLKDNHRCIERNLDSDCPICGDYLFTSTNTVIFMPCSHAIHWKCYQEHISNSYQCPICWKSLADMTHYFQQIDRMLEEHTMPSEFENLWSICLCNDCEKKSKTKYHFLYHKCQECGSYNTKILHTVQEINTRNLNGQGENTVTEVITTPGSISSAGLEMAGTEISDRLERPRSSSNMSVDSRTTAISPDAHMRSPN